MVEQAVRPVVEAILAQAPQGWTDAVMYARAGGGGTSVTGGYSPRSGPWGPSVPNPYQELMALAETLRKDRGWEPVSLEIRCEPSGAYRLTAFRDAVARVSGGMSGWEAVLDADYRLPQPGLRQEAGTAPPAGDPELAVSRFHTYVSRRAALLGRRLELPPPATAAELDEAERRLGRRLPADLRALYLIADGDGIGYEHHYLFSNCAWLSLKSLVAEHTEWQAGERPWYGWDLEWEAVVFDTTPAETVRRCGGHPGWLRFATSEDGNFLAVDTAPARLGHPGQIIRTGRDYDDGPAYVADSVTSLLGHQLDLLERGAYEIHGDHLSLHPRDSDSGPRQIIGAVPDEVPPTLQAIHINNAPGPVDLAPLAAAPHLRRLHLNRSTTTDLTPVRDLPVESLRVTLAHGDLTALADHPHLAALDLTTGAPADLRPLRTIPHLRGLDVSEADVLDPTVVADLAELRYLALTGRQWTAVLDEGKAPATLAAAHLTDTEATFDDALAWAARLGMDTEDALRMTGTVAGVGG
ncbi:SMI1/KNR4 family protein [Streptomyces sp. NPDC096205]|uniref:SMI1/KNR4 family protein n=1 Tax=Streptomyces sp. NPDC096205 TaxID=3366081 RepID=UPI0037F5D014